MKRIRSVCGEVGLCGYPRAGKDSLAKMLCEKEPDSWWVLPFARPLKEILVEMGLYVSVDRFEVHKAEGGPIAQNARHFAQSLGKAIRDRDPDFFVDEWGKAADRANEDGLGIIATDVRYRNERNALMGPLVAIVRPGYDAVNDHESEKNTEDLIATADILLHNDGTLEDLWEQFHREMLKWCSED